jgi:hypothetical protein
VVPRPRPDRIGVKVTAPSAKDHEQQLIDYLIEAGEAVEYGEPWTEETTHEWWIDTDGERHCRLVQTYHGGGSRGDDDQAEYARRLLDLGRAVTAESIGIDNTLPDPNTDWLPREVTHVVYDGVAKRFRRYNPPPEGVQR